MIDFRYHLVSLVSVFLALAVGIALGAGPLKEPIGNTLTDSVKGLRAQKEALRVDLGTANSSVQHRDDFIGAVSPALVAGKLADRSVAIVSLPGVDADKVANPLVDAITQAGGTVTGRVSVGGAWTDPAQEDTRVSALADLIGKLPPGSVPTAGSSELRLSDVLADALVTTGNGAGRSSESSSTVLGTLKSANLIAVKGDLSSLAGAALVLAPAPPDSTNKSEPTAASDAVSDYVTLVTMLDTEGGGAVVTGPPPADTDGGLVTAIRKDSAAKSRVSTVDTGQTAMGIVTAVLALREQLTGGSGAYGFGSGASRPVPIPATIPTGGTTGTTDPAVVTRATKAAKVTRATPTATEK